MNFLPVFQCIWISICCTQLVPIRVCVCLPFLFLFLFLFNILLSIFKLWLHTHDYPSHLHTVATHSDFSLGLYLCYHCSSHLAAAAARVNTQVTRSTIWPIKLLKWVCVWMVPIFVETKMWFASECRKQVKSTFPGNVNASIILFSYMLFIMHVLLFCLEVKLRNISMKSDMKQQLK